jgi:hypothetical protein
MVQSRVAKEALTVEGRGAAARPGTNALSLCPARSFNVINSFGGVCGGVNETNSTRYLLLGAIEPRQINCIALSFLCPVFGVSYAYQDRSTGKPTPGMKQPECSLALIGQFAHSPKRSRRPSAHRRRRGRRRRRGSFSDSPSPK